jgi:hypothetical protein
VVRRRSDGAAVDGSTLEAIVSSDFGENTLGHNHVATIEVGAANEQRGGS